MTAAQVHEQSAHLTDAQQRQAALSQKDFRVRMVLFERMADNSLRGICAAVGYLQPSIETPPSPASPAEEAVIQGILGRYPLPDDAFTQTAVDGHN